MKKVVFVLSVCIVAISFGLDCSNVVRKEQEGLLNWLGNITFVVPVSTGDSGWTLAMFFDQNFTGVGVWHAYVEYNGTEKWAEIRNGEDNGKQDAGDTLTLRFRVNYGLDIPQPKVISLRFQDIEQCN